MKNQTKFNSEDNKYFKWYWNICNKSVDRLLPDGTYTEKHHIYPKSIFGKNKILIRLTAKEHYMVHLLLWWGLRVKYGSQNKNTKKMAYAFIMMVNVTSSNQSRYKIQNANEFSLLKTARMENFSGKNHPCYGRKLPQYQKEILMEANRNQIRSDETREKMRVAQTGLKDTDETKLKKSLSHIGLVRTEEHKRNNGLAIKGNMFYHNPEKTIYKAFKNICDVPDTWIRGAKSKGSELRWYHNPETNESTRCKENSQPKGWIKGRRSTIKDK